MKKPGIEQRVMNFVRDNRLVEADRLLPVAVSGGPDSVCMLHVLNSLKEKLDIKLYIVHMDHQLRGEESLADARYVEELADRLNIPIAVKACDVTGYKNKYRLTLEEAAREVRYAFFAETVQEIGADKIAVGHTLDDNIETILMHIIRGTGTRGLRGLQPENIWQLGGNRVNVVRPLLTISREETQEYCRVHNLEPRLDSTNLSLSPLRNKIRLQLLPLLESYNTNIKGALLRTAKTAGDDLSFLETFDSRCWNEAAEIVNNTVVFNKSKFNRIHISLKHHLLRMAFEKLVGNLKDIESRHIEEILDALDKPAGKVLHLPYGLVFSIEYDKYLLGTDPMALSPFPPFEGDYPIKVPGDTMVGGWKITTSVIGREQMKKSNKLTAYMDYEKTGSSKLTVRTYRPGDRFQPLGMAQKKKLGAFMIDARIPHAWRSRIPVLCSPEQILWLVGYRIDDRVKVTEMSGRIIKVSFKRL